MPYIVGVVLAVGVALFARFIRLDRDRAFYPTVMIVIASTYVLFAAMTESVHTVALESVPMLAFVIAAVAGFRASAWILVVALAGHGVFDWFHSDVLENPGVPVWWPAFCLAYDVGAAGCLAWILATQDIVRATLKPTLSRRLLGRQFTGGFSHSQHEPQLQREGTRFGR